MQSDLFDVTLRASTHDLGGFKVHRTLPAKERMMVGPFLFFDQMGPARLGAGDGIDVRPHPHINLATVTYLFDGAIGHRDSLGTAQRIEPGAVNLMTAGHGIVHSERSPGDERAHGPVLSGIQTWLALPDAQEEIDPAFEHVPAPALPMIEAGGATARVIMGELWGARAPTTTYAGTIYADVRLAPGAVVPIDAAADERALYLVEGEAVLEGVPLQPLTLYVLKPGVAATLRSEGGGRAMLCGGDAFATPRHVWWNFVSSRRDRIEEAKRAWRAGEFARVPGDAQEWIPIPAVPKTVSYP
ncbi:pirin family protein [uncultured Sphingomonas sp.]|uniref:pirin family protein n=1 Tax=uncultured Sphingomonas sp. TaxID=158754 RepID=UPI0035CCA599